MNERQRKVIAEAQEMLQDLSTIMRDWLRDDREREIFIDPSAVRKITDDLRATADALDRDMADH